MRPRLMGGWGIPAALALGLSLTPAAALGGMEDGADASPGEGTPCQQLPPQPPPPPGAPLILPEAPEPPPPPAPPLPREALIVRWSMASGFPDAVGSSMSLTAVRGLDVEWGLALVLPTLYLRAGPSLRAVNHRRGEGARGWTVDVKPAVGYLLTCWPGEGQDCVGFQGVSGTVAGEAIYWVGRHFGLDVQLVGGGAVTTHFNSSRFFPLGRLSVGLAF